MKWEIVYMLQQGYCIIFIMQVMWGKKELQPANSR